MEPLNLPGIRFVSCDSRSAATLAALPAASVVTDVSEATLVAAGLKLLRNIHGLVVAIQLRDGQTFLYVPDAGGNEA